MFTKRLKELRKARGLSQGALAKELGLSQQAVGKWETGRSTPDPATLAALASFFKVSVDYLLGCGAAPQKIINAHFKKRCQRGKRGGVWCRAACLPLSHSLLAQPKLFCQRPLRKPAGLAQFFQPFCKHHSGLPYWFPFL